MSETEPAPLVAVVGPTGSGKSELALRIAEECAGEIVNCDSLQVYRHLDIGTAKLKPEERRGIPHHIIDILEPGEAFTAGDYARVARAALKEIAARGRVPVVAGGTGFYLRALLDGLFAGPPRDEALRARLAARERRRRGALHRLLARWDPEAARRIHAADVQKLIRALEVMLLARRPLTAMFAQGRDPLRGFRILKLGLNPPRAALYQRIERRCEIMFGHGLLDEVQRVLAMGVPAGVPPLQSIGYKQALAVLRCETTLRQAIEEAQRDTRHYAKRQWTWFRREAGIEWLEGFGDDARIQSLAIDRTIAFLDRKNLFAR